MRALFGLALLSAVALGASGEAPPLDRVNELITQLGSADFHTREAATRDLESAGPSALPALRRAATAADAEVARRATTLAERIARRADNDRTLAATQVELAVENAPLAAVFAALGKQSGYKLMAHEVDEAAVKVSVKTGGRVPFWVAVQQVCDATGLEVAAASASLSPIASSTEIELATPIRPVPLPWIPAKPIKPAGQALEPAPADRKADVAKDLAEMFRKHLDVTERLPVQAGAADRKRIEELRAAQLAEAQRLFAALAVEQGQQAIRSGSANVPAPPGTVVLRPKGKSAPACVSGAVRIEASSFPAAALATVPTGLVPVVLSSIAEPKLKWEQVESVRITRAIDEAGRTLTAVVDSASLTTTVQPIQGGAVVLDAAGGVVLVPNGGGAAAATPFRPQPTQAVVRLKCEGGSPKQLKELEGVIRAAVRSGPEEMASVVGFDKAAVAAFGPNGLGLKASKLEPVPDREDEFTLDVVVGYKAAEVQLADNSAPAMTETAAGNGQVIVRQQMVIGGEVVVRQRVLGPGFGGGRRGGFRVTGENTGLSVFGLTVTDAAGTPFELSAPTSVRRFDPNGGVTDEVKLVLKPTAKGQSKPARVAFAGIRAKTLEIPFKLTDVPVAAGTGPTEPPKPMKP